MSEMYYIIYRFIYSYILNATSMHKFYLLLTFVCHKLNNTMIVTKTMKQKSYKHRMVLYENLWDLIKNYSKQVAVCIKRCTSE